MACAAVVAQPDGAVVDVDAAIVAGPTVDAEAREATWLVVTRAAVLAGRPAPRALVHILRAVRACRNHILFLIINKVGDAV